MSLPKSAAGQSANYTLSLWTRLTLFLKYPELKLSNNLAENSMRPMAINGATGCTWGAKRLAQGSLPSSRSWKAAAVLACRSAGILATSCRGSPIDPYRRWLGLHPRPIQPRKQKNNLLPLLSQRQPCTCTRPDEYARRLSTVESTTGTARAAEAADHIYGLSSEAKPP